MIPTLFRWGGFRTSTGHKMPFEINCDALTHEDILCIANVIAAKTTFKAVYSVPTGGNRLGVALQQFRDGDGADRILIVDDVLTTGKSIESEKRRVTERLERMGVEFTGEIVGWVIFARTQPADWINAIFTWGRGMQR